MHKDRDKEKMPLHVLNVNPRGACWTRQIKGLGICCHLKGPHPQGRLASAQAETQAAWHIPHPECLPFSSHPQPCRPQGLAQISSFSRKLPLWTLAEGLVSGPFTMQIIPQSKPRLLTSDLRLCEHPPSWARSSIRRGAPRRQASSTHPAPCIWQQPLCHRWQDVKNKPPDSNKY